MIFLSVSHVQQVMNCMLLELPFSFFHLIQKSIIHDDLLVSLGLTCGLVTGNTGNS